MSRAPAVIEAAIDAGRGRIPFLIGLAALVFIPLGLLDAIDQSVSEIDTSELSSLATAASVAEVALTTASALLGGILYAGAVAVAVIHTPPGENPSLTRIVRETNWLTLIAIDLLFVVGMVAGILLLVVPGLIFFARYALAATVAELEDLGVRAGFRRSAEVGRGSRLLIFGLLFAVAAFGEALGGGAQQLLEALGVGTFIANWATSTVSDMIINPIWALIALALVMELGGAAHRGSPGTRSAATSGG